jgi:hypothetical protein
MYTEEIYSSAQSDHSILFVYGTVFAILVIGVLVRMTFHGAPREYVHAE